MNSSPCPDCHATVYHVKGCRIAKAEVQAMERNMAKTFSGKMVLVYDEQREKYGISLDNNDINFSLQDQFEGKEVIITIFEVKKN